MDKKWAMLLRIAMMCHMFLLAQSSDQGVDERVDDGWSNWSTWSVCSQNCGQGLSARSRQCRNRHSAASSHQISCSGGYKQYKICKGKTCPEGAKDYRTEQCARHNHKVFIGRRYNWEPFINPRNQCELSCRAVGFKFYAKFAPMVPDGIPCDVEDGEGACVTGKCQRVGCDGIVGSNAAKDQCAVCQGDNSTCRIISGIFMRQHLPYGYNTIIKIPAGSCNINITEMRPSRNYLAIQKSGREYVFNGNWRMSPTGQYKAVGTSFTYNRYRTRNCPGQCIYSRGPTNQTVQLQLLFYHKNPGIRYRFTVPLHMMNKVMTDMVSSNTGTSGTRRQSQPSLQHHHRRHHNYNNGRHHAGSRPSQAPASLRQLTAPRYVPAQSETYRSPSNTAQALSLSGSQSHGRNRPISYQHRGRTLHTPQRSRTHHNRFRPNTHTSGHNPASSKDSGSSVYNPQTNGRRLQYGQQPRYVSPYETQQQRLSYRYDTGGLNAGRRYNPPQYIPPQSPGRQALGTKGKEPTYPSQNALPESGTGTGRRFNRQGQPYIDDALNPQSKPAAQTSGSDHYTWRIAGFTECSQPCAGGTQETRVVCMKGKSEVVVTDDNCQASSKPQAQTVICNNQACLPQWVSDDFGPCSITCGDGTQNRVVECRQKISPTLTVSVSADLCVDQKRPVSYGQCNYKPCSTWQVGRWSKCSAECGLGERTRDVICVSASGDKLPSSHCQETKPEAQEVCDMGSCAKDWFYTRWTKECSADCGEGVYERQVFCSADDGSNLPESRCTSRKPRTKKHCKNKKPCGGYWFTGPWSGCSATCGLSMRKRDVLCMKRISSTLLSPVKDVNCRAEEKPLTEKPCADLGPCPPEWYLTEWSQCSASCDTGLRTREIKCLYQSLRPSTECDSKSKPVHRQSCNTQSCQRPQLDKDPGCKDQYVSFCVIVVQARLCSYTYYKERCCSSCRKHS